MTIVTGDYNCHTAEIDTILTPISQGEKLRLTEVRLVAKGI